MSFDKQKLDDLLEQLAPVLLPPAEFPPADIVRETPREELIQRIKDNAEEIGYELTDEHWEVINFLFDFYVHCTEENPTAYKGHKKYWEYIDCVRNNECEADMDARAGEKCPYGQLSRKEALKAYRVYRVLVKAFKDKGGKKHLYKLFPYGPLFTIHLLAQLPRLVEDIDPHYGTAY